MDFGIARAQQEGGGTRLTKAGMIVGTPEYMSPEQAEGRADIDCLSDLYSLGVVAYEMLCGSLPFYADAGASSLSLLMRHVRDQPRPPVEWQPALPPAINAALLRALAKTPQERFRSCHDFSLALAGNNGQENAASRVQRTAFAASETVAQAKAAPLVPRPTALPTVRRAPIAAYLGVGVVALAGVSLISAALLKQNRAGEPPPAAPVQKRSASQTSELSSPVVTSAPAAAPSSAAGAAPEQLSVPVVPEKTRPEKAALPSPAASASRLMGHWRGTFGSSRNAALDVTDTHGSRFTGVMTAWYPQGQVLVAIAGDMSSDPERVEFQETRVLQRPASKDWKLGVDTGRLAASGALEGRGTDGSSRYDWSFIRSAHQGATLSAGNDVPADTASSDAAYSTRRSYASAHANAFASSTRERSPTVPAGSRSVPDDLVLRMNNQELSETDLIGKTRWELTVACNQPYAWHGYRFKNASLASYFSTRSWYQPTMSDAESVEKRFTPLERHNAHLIRDYITKRSPQ